MAPLWILIVHRRCGRFSVLGPLSAILPHFSSLCRFYEKGYRPVSNSYALGSTFRTAQRTMEKPYGRHCDRSGKQPGDKSRAAAHILAKNFTSARPVCRLSKRACSPGDRLAPLEIRPGSLPSIDASRFSARPHSSQSRPIAPRGAYCAAKIMNRVRRRHEADARTPGAAPLPVAFLAMAAEEWRKLVAEVAHVFGGKRARRTTRRAASNQQTSS